MRVAMLMGDTPWVESWARAAETQCEVIRIRFRAAGQRWSMARSLRSRSTGVLDPTSSSGGSVSVDRASQRPTACDPLRTSTPPDRARLRTCRCRPRALLLECQVAAGVPTVPEAPVHRDGAQQWLERRESRQPAHRSRPQDRSPYMSARRSGHSRLRQSAEAHGRSRCDGKHARDPQSGRYRDVPPARSGSSERPAAPHRGFTPGTGEELPGALRGSPPARCLRDRSTTGRRR